MANVAGTTAQTVSDQMTAVWNNFYDGGKSLEYYSDVMVALGAATASSTDEISEGVNKFAAAAKTVGLSYEYATAALATITAKTRESADVVGNALKTIFSRLQGLNLGETLDDGTTLNKYSKALDAVGISIKTTDGQLKDMDTILDEMGAKWQTLGKDQQMALAQTVAGVRQYAQLIALMNNYDYFKENLNVAYGAEGTLKKQADIYAESWEAAEKRVRASMQGIYQSLIDDKFFIGINNALADALSGLDAFIDAAGGLPTVLTTIGSIFLSVFANKMPDAFKNLKYNLDVFTKGANAAYKNIVEEMKTATKQGYDDYAKSAGIQGIDPNSSSGYALQAANDLTNARGALANVTDKLSNAELQRYNTELNLIDSQQQEIVGLKQKKEALEENYTNLKNAMTNAWEFDPSSKIINAVNKVYQAVPLSGTSIFKGIEDEILDLDVGIQQTAFNINNKIIKALDSGSKSSIKLKDEFIDIAKIVNNVNLKSINKNNFADIKKQIEALIKTIPAGVRETTGLQKALNQLSLVKSPKDLKNSITSISEELDKAEINSKDFVSALKGMQTPEDIRNFIQLLSQIPDLQHQITTAQQQVNAALADFQPTHLVGSIEAISSAAAGLGNLAAGLGQIKGFVNALKDADLTPGERIASAFSSMAFYIPTMISLYRNLNTVIDAYKTKKLEAISVDATAQATSKTEVALQELKAKVQQANNDKTITSLAIKNRENAAKELGISKEQLEILVKEKAIKYTQGEIRLDEEKVRAILGEAAAQEVSNAAKEKAIALENKLAMVSKVAMIVTIVINLIQLISQFIPKAEEAGDALAGITQAVKDANSAYQELQNTLNNYKTGADKLKDLEIGTQDFTNALISANEEAYKLIENFNLIQGIDWKINPITGLIEFINQDLLDDLSKQQQERTEDVKAGQATMTNINAQKSVDNELKDINEKITPDLKYLTGQWKAFADDDFASFFRNQDFRKVLYEILGYSNGSYAFKKNTMSENDYINSAITQLVKAGYSGFQNSLGNENSSIYYALSKIYNNQLPISDLYFSETQVQRNQENYKPLLQENLSNEQAYQDTLFKNEILETLSSFYNDFYFNVSSSFSQKSQEVIDNEFANFLRQSGYFIKGNKTYATQEDAQNGENEITNLSNLSQSDKKNILIMIEVMNQMEASGIAMAENFNSIISNFSKESKDAIFQLSQGIQGFTTEQLENFKNDGGILLEDIFSPEDITAIENNNWLYEIVMKWIGKLNYDLLDWQSNFSLKDWTSKYKDIQNIVDKQLKEGYGAVVEATDYEKLGEEYSQYFAIQEDGTAVLIADVKELNEAIRNNKLKELNDDLEKNQQSLKKMSTIQQQALFNAGWTDESKINELIQNKYLESILNDSHLPEMVKKGMAPEFTSLAQLFGIDQGSSSVEDWVSQVKAAWVDVEALRQKISDEQFAKLQMASTVKEFKQWAEEADALVDDDKLTAWKVAFANIVSEAGLAMDSVSKYSKLLQTTMGMSVQEADEASMRYFQLLQGQKTFQSNWEDWDEKRQQGTLSKEIYSLQDALKNLVGSSEDLTDVDFGFFLKNWKLIEKAVDGDSNAVNELIKLLNELGYSIPNIEAVANGLVKAQSTFKDRQKIYSGLSVGDTISKDDYEKFLEAEKELFSYAGDDTYSLIADTTEEAQKQFRAIELEKAIKDKQKAQKIDSNIFSDFDNRIDYASSWMDQKYWNQNQIRETLNSQTFQDAANILDLIQNEGETASDYIKRVGQALLDLPDADQNLGKIVESVDELDTLLSNGLITLKEYNAQFNRVFSNDVKDQGFNIDEINDYAKQLVKVNDELDGNIQAAKKLALANSRLERGIKGVNSNWEDFSDMLKSVNGDFKKLDRQDKSVATNLTNMKESLADILDTDISNITDDMVEMAYSSGQLEGIFNGDKEALKDFQKTAAQGVVYSLHLDESKADVQNALLAKIDELQSYADMDPIEVDAKINTDDFIGTLNKMIADAGMTKNQVNAYFDDIGYEPVYDTDTQQTKSTLSMLVPEINYRFPFNLSVGWRTVDTDATANTEIPRIRSLHKKSSGGGLSSNKSSSSKGGGGGGGGSSKHAEKKNDIDKERYHTILNQLEDLNAEYDDISKTKDRVFGKDRLAYMDAEIKKTDELIAKQGEYLDEIKSYLPVDKAVLEATYKDLIGGPNMLFDEKGNISNFDAIQNAMYAKYNEMTEKFTEDDEQWDIFQKQYEQLEKYLDKYEETYDLLRDEEQKYQDLINQRIDAQLEKVQYKVEVKLDVSKDEVAVLEYQLGRIDDDAFKSIDAIDLLIDKSVQLKKQIEINKQGLNDALALSLSAAEISEVMAGNMSVLEGKNFTDEQVQAIKDYRDNLLSLNEELDDIRENIESKVLEAFDAWNEKLSTGVDIIDSYSSALDHFKNIVDIVGQDVLGLDENFMQGLSQTAVDNSINKVKATKAAMESTMAAQERAQRSLEKARAQGDEKSQKMWEDTLKQLDEEARSAQDTFLQAWEDALNSLADQFEQTVNRVVQNFNKTIYNLGGLEGLANDFSRQKEDSDMMLDDYQKIYELSKLSRDINKTIDDTDIISGKQKLKKLLGQVNDLQADGVKMSKYDLEYLQKTYDLRLAELELEEAQRAKNTVRLQKDNEGNWAYIYTQSTDAIDSAQQKYEDALYAMQDLSSNYIDEMSEKLINTSQEMADALAALRVQDFASLDDYYREVERVQKQYQDRMALQEDELNKAIANNKELYDTDWMNYHNATGYKISDTENFATSFKDTLLGALMQSDTDSSNFTELLGQSVQQLTNGLMQAAETYYTNLENAMNAAGTSTNTFGDDISKVIEDIKAKSAEGGQAVEDMANQMNNAINDTIETVENWQKTYSEAMEKIIQSNLDVINSFNELIKTLGADASDVNINYDIKRGTSSAQRFATGGYTGEWGSSGKLAILDEKELILNQSDTANMLSAIQLTREIMNAIDIGANYASLGFGNLVAASLRDNNKEVLEQNVHITAEFPNVNDHNEIELALRNLTNTASQYANRK